MKKTYEVWIYDEESGCNQPMRCEAKTTIEASSKGKDYIRRWGLIGYVTDIRLVG